MNGRAFAPPAIGLHHRRFHFQIIALVKEAPHRPQHFGPLHKYFARIEVGEQVDIPLPIAQLHVGQSVKLLRERQHRLRKKRQPLHVNAQLARPGAEQVAAHSHVIAKVQQLVKRPALLAHGIHPHINLQPLAALLQRRESGFAHDADSHDPAGDGHGRALGFQRLCRRLAPFRANLRNGMRGRELVGIRCLPQLLNLRQLAPAQLKEIALKFRIKHGIYLRQNQ